MLVKSETTLRIIILSFATIVSSSTSMSNSRPQSLGLPGNALTNSMRKIGTDRRSKAASPPIDRSTRRIFFWPWRPRWHRHRWWHRRPFGFGGSIYGGMGIGIGPGGGLGFHRPLRRPEIGAGTGAAFEVGIVASAPIYGQYQPEASLPISENNKGNSGAHKDPNYPDLPPIPNDFNGQLPIPSNGADLTGPSAVGFDASAEHSVGYERAVRNPVRYKKPGYLKHDLGRYKSDVNNASSKQNGSYMTIGDTDKKRIVQWLRDRYKNVATGQSDYEGKQNYSKDRETNSYGGDYEGDEQETYYDEDRYHDYPVVEEFFKDRDLGRANDAV